MQTKLARALDNAYTAAVEDLTVRVHRRLPAATSLLIAVHDVAGPNGLKVTITGAEVTLTDGTTARTTFGLPGLTWLDGPHPERHPAGMPDDWHTQVSADTDWHVDVATAAQQLIGMFGDRLHTDRRGVTIPLTTPRMPDGPVRDRLDASTSHLHPAERTILHQLPRDGGDVDGIFPTGYEHGWYVQFDHDGILDTYGSYGDYAAHLHDHGLHSLAGLIATAHAAGADMLQLDRDADLVDLPTHDDDPDTATPAVAALKAALRNWFYAQSQTTEPTTITLLRSLNGNVAVTDTAGPNDAAGDMLYRNENHPIRQQIENAVNLALATGQANDLFDTVHFEDAEVTLTLTLTPTDHGPALPDTPTVACTNCGTTTDPVNEHGACEDCACVECDETIDLGGWNGRCGNCADGEFDAEDGLACDRCGLDIDEPADGMCQTCWSIEAQADTEIDAGVIAAETTTARGFLDELEDGYAAPLVTAIVAPNPSETAWLLDRPVGTAYANDVVLYHRNDDVVWISVDEAFDGTDIDALATDLARETGMPALAALVRRAAHDPDAPDLPRAGRIRIHVTDDTERPPARDVDYWTACPACGADVGIYDALTAQCPDCGQTIACIPRSEATVSPPSQTAGLRKQWNDTATQMGAWAARHDGDTYALGITGLVIEWDVDGERGDLIALTRNDSPDLPGDDPASLDVFGEWTDIWADTWAQTTYSHYRAAHGHAAIVDDTTGQMRRTTIAVPARPAAATGGIWRIATISDGELLFWSDTDGWGTDSDGTWASRYNDHHKALSRLPWPDVDGQPVWWTPDAPTGRQRRKAAAALQTTYGIGPRTAYTIIDTGRYDRLPAPTTAADLVADHTRRQR